MKLVFVHTFHHVSESFEKTETLFCALSVCRFYGTVCIHVRVELTQRTTQVTFRIDMSLNLKPIYNKSSILNVIYRVFSIASLPQTDFQNSSTEQLRIVCIVNGASQMHGKFVGYPW